jgi:putative Holliday junction resolvase
MAVTPDSSILSLDVGNRRIGLAIASLAARLPRPLMTLINDDDFIPRLSQLIKDEGITLLVVGYPRNLSGDATSQTASVEAFVNLLKEQINLPFHFQDEALTSNKAETELMSRGKLYDKGDVDALAATYILEDYLHEREESV